MGSPAVSVIIPAYNRVHLLERAIRSVLTQTFQDFEILVVDDGSSDNIGEVVRGFGDHRIVCLRHEQNRGPAAARNTGMRAARGEYLAFLDSDDEWLPRKLECQLEVFRQTQLEKLGIVVCGVMYVGAAGAEPVMPKQRGWLYEDLLAGRSFRYTPTFLVRRSAWDHGFDETLRSQEDWDYLLRASQHCQIDFVAEPMVVIDRTDHDHIHRSVTARIEGYRLFLGKHYAELAKRPQVLSAHHETVALWCLRAGCIRESRQHLLNAIRIYPRNPKAYVWLAASVLGAVPFRAVTRVLRPASQS